MHPQTARSHESNTTLHDGTLIQQSSSTRRKGGGSNQVSLSVGTSHDHLDMQVSWCSTTHIFRLILFMAQINAAGNVREWANIKLGAGISANCQL